MHAPAPFIVGAGRSGTTLLRLMLDTHPAVAIPAETGFVRLLATLDDGVVSRDQFVAAVMRLDTWPDLATTEQELRVAILDLEPLTLASGLRAFYQRYAATHDKPRWGDKTPMHALHLPSVRRLFPEARFLHIVRDGRAVAASIRTLWFRSGDTIEELAAEWARTVRRAQSDGVGRADYFELRYEDLVREPEGMLRRVAAHIELEYDTTMLDYPSRALVRLGEVRDRVGPDGQLVISRASRLSNHRWTNEAPEPARIDSWRQELDRADVRAFSVVAGDLLEELGYPTA